jgi:hypothetical protein
MVPAEADNVTVAKPAVRVSKAKIGLRDYRKRYGTVTFIKNRLTRK